MELVILGRILKPHHLKGEVKVLSFTSFAFQRYQKNNTVFLKSPDDNRLISFSIESYRQYKNHDYIKFNEITSIEDAEKYRNYFIVFKKEDLPKLSDGNFYYTELLDMDVICNNLNGKVIAIEEYKDVCLRVKKIDGTTFLVPFIQTYIQNIDLENKKIYLNYIRGLYD